MSPGQYDFEIYQGASWELGITYQDSQGKLVDFTGYEGRMQIRSALDNSLLHELSSTNEGVVLASTAPNIKLKIPRSVSARLDQRGVYDLFVSKGETSLAILAGEVTIQKARTHDQPQ